MRSKAPIPSACSAAAGRTKWRWAIVVWLLAIVGMFLWITRYEFSTYANDRMVEAQQWPVDSLLELSAERPSLVLFIHPHCPCTRATISELQGVLDAPNVAAREQPNLIVVISLPVDAGPDWAESDTTRRALALPNATKFLDFGGVEANRFGAVSSGTVMLYSTAARQLYAGGVTVSRGHEGDNLGAAMLSDLLHNPAASSTASFPAFGCRLCLPTHDPTTDS